MCVGVGRDSDGDGDDVDVTDGESEVVGVRDWLTSGVGEDDIVSVGSFDELADGSCVLVFVGVGGLVAVSVIAALADSVRVRAGAVRDAVSVASWDSDLVSTAPETVLDAVTVAVKLALTVFDGVIKSVNDSVKVSDRLVVTVALADGVWLLVVEAGGEGLSVSDGDCVAVADGDATEPLIEVVLVKECLKNVRVGVGVTVAETFGCDTVREADRSSLAVADTVVVVLAVRIELTVTENVDEGPRPVCDEVLVEDLLRLTETDSTPEALTVLVLESDLDREEVTIPDKEKVSVSVVDRPGPVAVSVGVITRVAVTVTDTDGDTDRLSVMLSDRDPVMDGEPPDKELLSEAVGTLLKLVESLGDPVSDVVPELVGLSKDTDLVWDRVADGVEDAVRCVVGVKDVVSVGDGLLLGDSADAVSVTAAETVILAEPEVVAEKLADKLGVKVAWLLNELVSEKVADPVTDTVGVTAKVRVSDSSAVCVADVVRASLNDAVKLPEKAPGEGEYELDFVVVSERVIVSETLRDAVGELVSVGDLV